MKHIKHNVGTLLVDLLLPTIILVMDSVIFFFSFKKLNYYIMTLRKIFQDKLNKFITII